VVIPWCCTISVSGSIKDWGVPGSRSPSCWTGELNSHQAFKTIQQIERARSAVSLLERGTPISNTAFELGYFDQAHLSNSLKRFMGRTPAQIAQQSTLG
jgi:AraC-like DNA-binding protein